MKQTLQRVIDLQKLLLLFNETERTLLLPSKTGKPARNESDTEHSFSLAMVAWYLARDIPRLNTDKCIRYALVHDLVEIYAGDTFLYDKDMSAHSSKADREHQAASKLAQDWPDFKDMTEYITGYKERRDPESRFVYALDKLMPMVINHLSEGINYRRLGVTLNDVKQAKESRVAVSDEIAALYRELIALFESKPEYFS